MGMPVSWATLVVAIDMHSVLFLVDATALLVKLKHSVYELEMNNEINYQATFQSLP